MSETSGSNGKGVSARRSVRGLYYHHSPSTTPQERHIMARVLLVIGDAAEVLDTFYPLFRIREDGHEVLVAGPAKRRYHLVLHERPEGWDITEERPGYHLAADVA